MSNQQSSADKQKINVWAPKSLVGQIDGIAAGRGVSRAAVVVEALEEYVEGGSGSSRVATKADLVALAATITRAIHDQPIAVQQAQVPAPQPTALPEADGEPARRSYEDGEAAGREAERARIAAMGWSERRRYLRR